jgi:hypothetical protein
LVKQLYVLGGDRLRESRENLRVVKLVAFEIVHRLLHGDADEQRGQLIEYLCIVRRKLFERPRATQQLGHIHRTQQLSKPHHMVARNRAEHGPRFLLTSLAAAKRNQLIEQ